MGPRSRRHLASGQRRTAAFKARSEAPAVSEVLVFVYKIKKIDVGVAGILAPLIPFYENEKNAA